MYIVSVGFAPFVIRPLSSALLGTAMSSGFSDLMYTDSRKSAPPSAPEAIAFTLLPIVSVRSSESSKALSAIYAIGYPPVWLGIERRSCFFPS